MGRADRRRDRRRGHVQRGRQPDSVLAIAGLRHRSLAAVRSPRRRPHFVGGLRRHCGDAARPGRTRGPHRPRRAHLTRRLLRRPRPIALGTAKGRPDARHPPGRPRLGPAARHRHARMPCDEHVARRCDRAGGRGRTDPRGRPRRAAADWVGEVEPGAYAGGGRADRACEDAAGDASWRAGPVGRVRAAERPRRLVDAAAAGPHRAGAVAAAGRVADGGRLGVRHRRTERARPRSRDGRRASRTQPGPAAERADRNRRPRRRAARIVRRAVARGVPAVRPFGDRCPADRTLDRPDRRRRRPRRLDRRLHLRRPQVSRPAEAGRPGQPRAVHAARRDGPGRPRTGGRRLDRQARRALADRSAADRRRRRREVRRRVLQPASAGPAAARDPAASHPSA